VGLAAAGSHKVDDGLGVVSAVGDERLGGREAVDQRLSEAWPAESTILSGKPS
jgi:hypothetical protein